MKMNGGQANIGSKEEREMENRETLRGKRGGGREEGGGGRGEGGGAVVGKDGSEFCGDDCSG
jgi:hypothetical protein